MISISFGQEGARPYKNPDGVKIFIALLHLFHIVLRYLQFVHSVGVRGTSFLVGCRCTRGTSWMVFGVSFAIAINFGSQHARESSKDTFGRVAEGKYGE